MFPVFLTRGVIPRTDMNISEARHLILNSSLSYRKEGAGRWHRECPSSRAPSPTICTPHTARATPSHFRARLTIACHAPEPSSTSRILIYSKAPMRIGRLLRIVLTYRILSHPVLSYPIQSISYSLIRDDSTAWQVNTFTMNMLVQTFTTMVLVLQADCALGRTRSPRPLMRPSITSSSALAPVGQALS